ARKRNEIGTPWWGGRNCLGAERRPLAKLWIAAAIAIAVVAPAWLAYSYRESDAAASPANAALPEVMVSKPLVREVYSRLGFLGQFSPLTPPQLPTLLPATPYQL